MERERATWTSRFRIIKNGKVLASEVLVNPSPGEVTKAIGRVSATARKSVQGPLAPYQIDVREP
jgi:hypothetical protein